MSQSSSLTSTSHRLKCSASADFVNKQIAADEVTFKERRIKLSARILQYVCTYS